MKQVGIGGKPLILNLSGAALDAMASEDGPAALETVSADGAPKASPAASIATKSSAASAASGAPKHKLPAGLKLSRMSCLPDEKV